MLTRRKPLRRYTPLRRGAPPRARRAARRRSSRVYDSPFMAWVKANLPCAARALGPCGWGITFDHMGRRGRGQKCSDTEGAAMCRRHHQEREDFSGAFKTWDQSRMRAFLAEAIATTRAAWERAHGIGAAA